MTKGSPSRLSWHLRVPCVSTSLEQRWLNWHLRVPCVCISLEVGCKYRSPQSLPMDCENLLGSPWPPQYAVWQLSHIPPPKHSKNFLECLEGKNCPPLWATPFSGTTLHSIVKVLVETVHWESGQVLWRKDLMDSLDGFFLDLVGPKFYSRFYERKLSFRVMALILDR